MDRLVRNWDRTLPRVVTMAALDSRRPDDGSVDVVRLPRPSWMSRRAVVGVLNGLAVVEALRFHPDVIVSGHVNVGPAALAVSRMSRVPYVQYVHGREAVIRPRLSRYTLRGAAAVVAVSRYSAALAVRYGAEPARVHRIPPGVDLPAHTVRSASEHPTVVCVSRLDERYKGHDVLIRAMPLVRSRVPDARLVLVGDGQLRQAYTRLASALGLNGAVEFAGSVPDVERDRILERSHVFAMASRLPPDGGGEGYGIAYLEAGLHGLPVVAGNVAGALDAVADGETGLLVDPTDHVAVAEAIATLLLDRGLAVSLGRAGAERARDHSWPLIARRVEDLVLEVAR
jgi:phosphatidylinositol alpha-1,6-mannosyltransferase